MRPLFVLLAASAIVSVGNVSASPLVTNGGFETGNLTGWTVSGQPQYFLVCATGTLVNGANCTSYQGTYTGAFGPSITESISQNIVTIPGDSYTVSFAYFADSKGQTPDNTFSASFGSTTLLSDTNRANSPYSLVSYSGEVATGSSTPLTFTIFNLPGAYFLDDISVTDQSGSPTPEPASFFLLGGALLAFGIYRLVSKRATA